MPLPASGRTGQSMKKSKIFATVIYFIFTFGIGVLFALTLPGYFAAFTVPAEVIASALARGDYLTGLVLAEPVGFCREPALESKFDAGGIVLYRAVMEVYDRSSAEDAEAAEGKLTHGMLYKCYLGYVYGVKDSYEVFSTSNNGTSLAVTQEDGTEKILPLLDYDQNGDGVNDGISTYKQRGFILLEIRESDVSSIRSLRFTDRSGETALTAFPQEALTFRHPFYDCFGDIDGYNALVADGAEGKDTAQERNAYVDNVLAALRADPAFVATSGSEEYAAAVKTVNKSANNKAIPFIIIYFVAIYIIADFLLGTHFIIKFFQWFLFKVCKIPRKGKKRAAKEDVFGHDYYSMVTLTLDVTEVPGFDGSVEIKYSAGGEEFVFTLLKEENYSATLRLKAGTYVNPFIDIDRAYAPVDLPDNLEVEGYRMEKTIRIVKREV